MFPVKAASTWAVVLFIALGTAACESSSAEKTAAGDAAQAQAVAAAEAAKPVSGVVAEQLVQGTAKVLAVHRDDRHVLLQREDGMKFAVACGPEVRNFDQISVGDTVTVGYYESLAYEVHKPGEATPGVEAVAAAGRAKKGEMPGAGVAQAVKVTATIVAIDTPGMHVSLKGPDGNVATVKVRDAEKLSRVSVGDLVDIVYTEALAVSVTKQ
jgi:hypothetical protein